MNPELQKLFASLQGWGLLDKQADFKSFESSMQDQAKQSALYGLLKKQNRVSMLQEDFNNAFFVKKKEPGGKESEQPQAPSLAPSSLPTVPAPPAVSVSGLEPTAGFPEPQKSVTEIQPGTLPGPQAPLDPLQQMAGGPTPEFGQPKEADKYLEVGPAGVPAQKIQFITGDEDPLARGEEIQKGLGNYESRKKYDEATPYRKAQRDMNNVLTFGNQARRQMDYATEQLNNQLGKTWQKDLETMAGQLDATSKDLQVNIENLNVAKADLDKLRESGDVAAYNAAIQPFNARVSEVQKMQQGYQELQKRYETVTADPMVQTYMAAGKALGNAQEKYKEIKESGPVKSVEQKRKSNQAARQQNMPIMMGDRALSPVSDDVMAFTARKGLELLSGVLSIPQTLGGALSEMTGLENPDAAKSDYMAKASAKVSEWADANLPKAPDTERQLFERVVPAEKLVPGLEGEVVVNGDGEFIKAYDKSGMPFDVEADLIEGFNKSGNGKESSWRTAPASAWVDKTANMTADLFIARGLGGGTKMGTTAATFVQTHQSAYDEAIKNYEASPNDAAIYATTTAVLTGLLEAYVGDIETTMFKPTSLTSAVGKAEMKALIKDVGPAQALFIAAKKTLKTTGEENLEENLQKVADMYARAEFNATTGAKMENTWTLEEFVETTILTTMLSGTMGATQSLGAVDDMKKRAVLEVATKGSGNFEKLLQSMQDANTIVPGRAEELKERARKINQYAGALDPKLTDDQKATALAKEWNRMEAEARSKDKNVLPAQAGEAKKVAAALEAEIVQDIQPVPEPEIVQAEEAKTPAEAETMAPQPIALIPEEAPAATPSEGVKVGGKTIVAEPQAEVEVGPQPALQVEPLLPPAFTESDKRSTAVSEGYSNNAMASTVDVNDPAVRDEIGNIALQELKQRGYEASEAEAGTIKRFFADSLSDTEMNQKVTIQDAFGMLSEEYIDSMAEKRPLRERLDTETLDDQIAGFFASGGKVNPVSYDRYGDPNMRKDKSVSALYFKKNARALDDLANEWVNDDTINTQGLDEQAVVARIVEFMNKYGKKNINDYLAGRVETQEEERRATRMRERFAGQENVEEVEQQAKERIIATKMSPEVEAKIDEWLDPYADQQGNVDVDAMREGIRKGSLDLDDPNFDVEASKRWQGLGLEGQNVIESLAKGREVERVEPDKKIEPVETGMPFDEWSADYRDNDGSLDIEKIKKEWDAAGEFEWAASVSEQAYKQIESIVNEEQARTARAGDGQRVQVQDQGAEQAAPAKSDQAKKPAGVEKPDKKAKESPSKAVERVIAESDIATSKEALDEAIPKVEETLKKAELPDKLTPELAFEMADQGIISYKDALLIEDHLNNEADINPDIIADAKDGIEKLREVPEWLASLDAAQIEHTKAVIRGEKMPGQMYTSNTPEGGMVFGNADHAAAKLKDAGAVKRGRGWYASPEVRDAVLAQVYGPGAKFSMVDDGKNVARSGSMEGPVTRFFRRQFGNAQARRLKDAIKKAKSVDDKISAAKRMTRGASVAQAKKIAETLSKKFGINTVMDQAGIAEALSKMGRGDLVMPDGTVSSQVRGFFYDGKVYINMDMADTETPIHEFGHVFLEAIKGSPLYAQFESAIRGSVYEDTVRANPMYAGMNDAEIVEEAMALAIGQRGAALADPGAWLRFADMLDSLWAQMKALFGIDVQDMNAREFADYMATMVMEDSTMAVDIPNSQAPAFLFLGEKAFAKREETAVFLSNAREMENQGVDERMIWLSTGWFRGVDGMWRYEIADAYSGMAMTQAQIEDGAEYMLEEIFDHPDLYSIAPDIGKVRVKFQKGGGTFYMPLDQGFIFIDVDGINKRTDLLFEMGDLKHTIIHEVQHHIQRTEGFARGGSPTMGKTLVAEARKKNYAEPVPGAGFNLMAMEASGAYAAYSAMAGEVEARLAADRKSSANVTREMPLDAMDIAPENQILVFPKKDDTVESLNERAAKMDPLKAPFITARFLFGRNRIVDSGKVLSARQIIRDRLNNNVDPNLDGTMAKLKKELGLNDATLSKIFAEEMKDSSRGRIVSPSGKRAFQFDTAEFAKTVWKKWFTKEKGLPTAAFDAKNEWHRNVKATFFQFQQKMGTLEDKVSTLAGGNDRRISDIFQQINNVLTGRQDINTLHPDLQGDVLTIRKGLDELSRNLVLSGAVESRDMAFTILRNAGVEISDANRPWAKMVVSAMRKNPAERTDEENRHIQQFLNTYGNNLGTYLYRSYRANEITNWKERVTDDVRERAREVIRKMALNKMQAEVDALDDKNMPLNDMVEDLKIQLGGHIDTAKKAIFVARLDLNEAIQDQIDYGTTGKGKEDVALTAKMKRQKERLFEADKRVEKEQENLDKIIVSQRQFQRTQLKASKALAIQELATAKKLKEAKINVAKIRDQIQETIAEQQIRRGQPGRINKTIAKREQANLKKLDAALAMLNSAEAAANMPAVDFYMMTQQAGWNPTPVNSVLRSIYARRKEIMALEERMERANAASYERLQYIERALQDPDAEIGVILTRDSAPAGILKSGRLGSKDLSVITGRQKSEEELPEEIRDLLGEYTDARVNVMRSVYRIVNTIEAANFLFATVEAGIQEGWLSPFAMSEGGMDQLVAPAGSKGMGPLAGMYTTAAIADAINSYNAVEVENIAFKIYFKIRGFIKKNLTVYSPGSQGRNMQSNLLFAASMGWLNPLSINSWKDFIRATAAYNKTQDVRAKGIVGRFVEKGIDIVYKDRDVWKDVTEEMEEGYRYGVISTSISAGELRASARYMDGVIAEGYGPMPYFDAEIEKSLSKPFKKADELAARAYQGTDTLLKIWGWRQEQRKYAKALFGKKLEDLDADQLKAVKQRAADVVIGTTPDYEMLPKAMEIMRQIPAFGTFLAWQMEMYRNTYNRVNIGIAEVKDERTRTIGIQRLMLGAAYATAIHAAEFASAAALKCLDYEKIRAMPKLLKPWEQNTAKIYFNCNPDKGEISYYTIGNIDPYGFWKKPVIAMYNNSDSVDKSLKAGFDEFTKQIMSPELTFAIMDQLYNDINLQTKKPIMLTGHSRWHYENLRRQAEFIRKRAQPGILKPIFDLWDSQTVGVIDEYGNVKTISTIMANTLGVQVSVINPELGFKNLLKSMRFKKEDIMSPYNSEEYKAAAQYERVLKSDLTKEQKAKWREDLIDDTNYIYDLQNPVYQEHLKDVTKIVKEAYEVWKIDPGVIDKELQTNRYGPEERAVIYERIRTWNIERKIK